jgi:hypothetical protein
MTSQSLSGHVWQCRTLSLAAAKPRQRFLPSRLRRLLLRRQRSLHPSDSHSAACRRAGRVEDPPASGHEFGCKFADGSSATLDLENGRVRVHTPFGNLELKS